METKKRVVKPGYFAPQQYTVTITPAYHEQDKIPFYCNPSQYAHKIRKVAYPEITGENLPEDFSNYTGREFYAPVIDLDDFAPEISDSINHTRLMAEQYSEWESAQTFSLVNNLRTDLVDNISLDMRQEKIGKKLLAIYTKAKSRGLDVEIDTAQDLVKVIYPAVKGPGRIVKTFSLRSKSDDEINGIKSIGSSGKFSEAVYSEPKKPLPVDRGQYTQADISAFLFSYSFEEVNYPKSVILKIMNEKYLVREVAPNFYVEYSDEGYILTMIEIPKNRPAKILYRMFEK